MSAQACRQTLRLHGIRNTIQPVLVATVSAICIALCPAEAIRESDIAKLSFAVQLAEGLYERFGEPPQNSSHASSSSSSPAAGLSFTPGSMLWLIQRDFLNGAAAAQVVSEALAPVDNPSVSTDLHAGHLSAMADKTCLRMTQVWSLCRAGSNGPTRRCKC